MSEPREPPNPYVAPASAPAKRTHARGDYLKWIFIVLVSVGPAAMYFTGVTQLSVVLAVVGMLACNIVGFVWFLAAWSSIPEEDRHATQLGRYSFFWVVMRFFIPLYGWFWLFSAIRLLCQAINESLTKRGMPMRTSALLGATAPLLRLALVFIAPRDLVGMVLSHATAGLMWFLFMLMTDHARRFMVLAALAEREKNEAARQALKNATAARRAATPAS